MKKLVILSLIAPAVLGLAACTPPAANNTTVDMNMTGDDTAMGGNDMMMTGNDTMMAGNDMAAPMNAN